MSLADGKPIALTSRHATELTAALTVTDDNSYRIALADRDGMSNPGDTEYFIRTLDDRPPEVRVLKPATDRGVTRLEEVDIEAQAEDDYGIERLDLVYAVRGGDEKVVPLDIPKRSTTVNGRHTLFLEDLDVQPGDFVSYYVRARDITRGTRPNEARSDIFFLEVKPYEQEFALAQSQGSMPGGGRGRSTTWSTRRRKSWSPPGSWIDVRRSQRARSPTRTSCRCRAPKPNCGRASSRRRARSASRRCAIRESGSRSADAAASRRRLPPQPELKAGQTLPEEDDMTAAAMAMGQAVTSLDALKTAGALPPEMEALNRLLKAQADVKRREIQRQQAGSGSGSNRSNYDMSALFDKELQKSQQTNYETKSSASRAKSPRQSALDKIKELARRQDELLKRQQELARDRAKMSEEELKRVLEQLTREQSELRQKAEELARQMASQDSQQSGGQAGRAEGRAAGSERPAGTTGPAGSAGQQGQSGQAQAGQPGRQVSRVSPVRAARPSKVRPASPDSRDKARTQQAHARRFGGDAQRRERSAAAGPRPGERARQHGARAVAPIAAAARVRDA